MTSAVRGRKKERGAQWGAGRGENAMGLKRESQQTKAFGDN